ncbi:hypothetical protein EYF80_002853 [Liparis tanakae]|uniref:Uncharacterized protein n=1 Tax=Liparis tanakae TaxID=230148 RepID=A0A4Z2JBT3_9TELE|nr:hypothetical protein EYF80_002853 [Liparis tanakae]
MVQEYLRPFLAGLVSQYLLILPQCENLIIHQVGKHGADVQLAQDLLAVPFEDLGRPSLLLPGARPPARPVLVPLLLLHEPLLRAAAKHLRVEGTHQSLFHDSVNAVPEGEEAFSTFLVSPGGPQLKTPNLPTCREQYKLESRLTY